MGDSSKEGGEKEAKDRHQEPEGSTEDMVVAMEVEVGFGGRVRLG